MELELGANWYLPVAAERRGLLLGGRPLAADAVVRGPAGAALTAGELREAARAYAGAVRAAYRPPLAALAAYITGDPAALRPCFPLTGTLDPAGLAAFDALARALASAPGLDLRLFDLAWGRLREAPLPADAALLVAGQLAELFFVRRDLLDALLAAGPRVWLYATPQAFAAGGGVAGGCYSPGEGAIKLALGRLYEGLTGPTPGVAPLLHELGHMLDCLEPGRGRLGAATGLYPGLRPGDGPAFTPEARRLFARGKALERERYELRVAGARGVAPIGHPYVFQSDGEFLAGYLELFMRSPNAFAAQNPDLYAAYVALFGHDPRLAWPADFPFYLEANSRYYASGQTPPPHGLSGTEP